MNLRDAGEGLGLLRVVQGDGVLGGHGVHHAVGQAEQRLCLLPGLRVGRGIGVGALLHRNVPQLVLDRAEPHRHAVLSVGERKDGPGNKAKVTMRWKNKVAWRKASYLE